MLEFYKALNEDFEDYIEMKHLLRFLTLLYQSSSTIGYDPVY